MKFQTNNIQFFTLSLKFQKQQKTLEIRLKQLERLLVFI